MMVFDALIVNPIFSYTESHATPIPVAERSKAWVCSRSPAGIAGSNFARGMDVCCEFFR